MEGVRLVVDFKHEAVFHGEYGIGEYPIVVALFSRVLVVLLAEQHVFAFALGDAVFDHSRPVFKPHGPGWRDVQLSFFVSLAASCLTSLTGGYSTRVSTRIERKAAKSLWRRSSGG